MAVQTWFEEGMLLSATVDGQYYSYASGQQEVVDIYNPLCVNYSPRPCFDHCASLVDNKWYLYGGIGCTNLSHIDEYEPTSQRWHQYLTTGNIPTASAGQACVSIGSKLYCFGGYAKSKEASKTKEKYTNALCELDIKSKVWRTLRPENPEKAPIPKRNPAMIAHSMSLVTFGGYGVVTGKESSGARYDRDNKYEGWTNELIRYDLEKNIWIVPEVCGISPQPCSECTLTGISQDRAILLGGIGRNWECVHNLEMIKILDMSSPVWSWITMKSSCKKLSPSHRYGHCAISLHELTSNSLEPEVLMLWGRDEKYELNDAWMLRKNQDEEYQWIELEFPSGFNKRWKSAFKCTAQLVLTSNGKQLIRFGGMINDKLKPVDNTRIIDIQESSDEGLIYFLTCRIPKPTSDETATIANENESISEECNIEPGSSISENKLLSSSSPPIKEGVLTSVADYPNLVFFNQSEHKELTSSEIDQEIKMKDIGVTVSIPAGAIHENESVSLEVHPVAYGKVEMPENCVSHSPLYIIPTQKMHQEIKISIEHSCNIETEEDCKKMVFLGLDPQPDGTTYRVKEIPNAKTNFKIGSREGEIYLKDMQPLRIGRRLSSSDSPNKDEKKMYSVMLFRNPSPTKFDNIAIFSVSQLQSTYIKCVENWIEKRHPEFKKICHQPVYFVDEQVKLIPGDVDGWDVDTDKEVILKGEVDLPDERDIHDLDYPPLITIESTRKTDALSHEKESCELTIVGLKGDISFKLPLLKTNVEQYAANLPQLDQIEQFHYQQSLPFSPPFISTDLLNPYNGHFPIPTASEKYSSTGVYTSKNMTPPATPKCYTDDTELTLDDLQLLLRCLKEASVHWYSIGIDLKIPAIALDLIKTNLYNAVRGDTQYFCQMMITWLGMKPSSKNTVKVLRSALENAADLNYLSSELIQKLNSAAGEYETLLISEGSESHVNETFTTVEEKNSNFENYHKKANFESDIKQAAVDLRMYAERWEENKMLVKAKNIASLIESIQLSLSESSGLLHTLKKIKEECYALTRHESLKLLTVDNQKTGKELKDAVDKVMNYSHQLEFHANSQLKKCVIMTEDVSSLLLQNVHNLSDAIQSLLRNTEIASLNVVASLSWMRLESLNKPRSSSVKLRKKELEESGLPLFRRSLQETLQEN